MATEMLAVTAPSFTSPSNYQLSTVARPVVQDAHDVLIKVYAASINPIDVKKADGIMKMFLKEDFPYRIGYDCAGVVEAVGSAVTRVKPGDEVYSRLPENERGSWAEYVKAHERFIALKPKNVSFNEAASFPLATLTAMQALERYGGSLEGKTVFIPAGLSGTGAYACQLAKNVFHASKVITTVSTAKLLKVPALLEPEVVDLIIDYQKQNPRDLIAAGSVDFLFDTTGQGMDFLPLMTPKTSKIVSISTKPSATTLQNSSTMSSRPEKPTVPLLARLYLNADDALRKWRASRAGVDYEYIFMEPTGAGLDDLRGWIEDGKIKPVVGTTVDIRDLDKVKGAAGEVYSGKGGTGKAVLEVVKV